ncbi:MAG: tetratricopeptide repeat protein [Clostridia bacterium]|nr:tetratricopeptide repeat protein [Clostridia bacterium]
MERYKRLFQSENNLYVEDSPVVVSAGAITKDTETGKVFAQIKTKNISDKTIKAIIVMFSGYDVENNPVGDTIKYEYLDLDCGCGREVGSKTPIYLDNSGTRSFRIENINVIFSDGSSCKTDFSGASPLPCQKTLSDVYDEDQTSQFKKLFGEKSRFVPQKYADVYLCACGAVNKTPECFSCGGNTEDMLTVDADALKNDGVYDKATAELNKIINNNYENALTLFSSIAGWKDSSEKADECRAKIEKIKLAKKIVEAERKREEEEERIATEKAKAISRKAAMIGGPIVAALIVFLIVLSNVILPANNYKKALAAAEAGNYHEAYHLFANYPDYKDTKEQFAKTKLKQASDLLDEGKYDEAYKIFEEIGDKDAITESMYNRAVDYLEAKDYDNAYNLFIKTKDYKDSNSKIQSIVDANLKYKYVSAEEGDFITIGKYYQNNSKTKDNIQWLVLKKEDSRILVVSRYALDCIPYDTSKARSAAWETCTLRKWLNDTFFNLTFSEDEQKIICSTSIITKAELIEYNTIDRLFLLSNDEASAYFGYDDAERQCTHTPYAKEHFENKTSDDVRYDTRWWLRDPGRSWHGTSNLDASIVDQFGKLYREGWPVYFTDCYVRPAMWIDIS